MVERETWEATFDPQPVNTELLHEELLAAMGDGFVGVCTGPSAVRVVFNRPLRAGESERIHDVLAAHDYMALSTRQAISRARQIDLETMRAAHPEALDVEQVVNDPDALEKLAQRVLWLETEILHLRGG